MAGVNKVILIGNLGADPEVRHLQNDVTVANFNIATSEYLQGQDRPASKREQTEWHRVVAWRWHRGDRGEVPAQRQQGVRGRQVAHPPMAGQGRATRATSRRSCADEMTMLDRPHDRWWQQSGSCTGKPRRAAAQVSR